MSSRWSQQPQRQGTQLRFNLEEARQKIRERIDLADRMLEVRLNNGDDLINATKTIHNWDEYNYDLLKRVVTSDEFSHPYRSAIGMPDLTDYSLGDARVLYREAIEKQKRILESVWQRLELVDPQPGPSDVLVAALTRVATADSNPVASPVIFIGHGRDPQWRELRDLLEDHHHLQCIAFETSPEAGNATKEVLEERLGRSHFALLVATADDTDAEGKRHARENVIHEIGLFQGRLGFRRAIVLLENGCDEFSNIKGTTQIRFEKGKVGATVGEIVATVKREFPNWRG